MLRQFKITTIDKDKILVVSLFAYFDEVVLKIGMDFVGFALELLQRLMCIRLALAWRCGLWES